MAGGKGFLIAGGILIGALALAVLLVSLAPEPERRDPPSQVPYVETATISAGSGPIPVYGAGTVRPSAEIEIAPQVAGKVVWVNPAFQSGRRVEAGETLFRIEQEDYVYRLREAEATLAACESEFLEAQEEAAIARTEANAILEDSILAGLTATYPDLTFSFGGEQQQQIESLDALYRGFILAMLMIFALLAIPLHSYSKPFIVMAIIPFGLVGVILGHLILGISMSAASFMGFFGLSGVVVNDSLVMIDFIEQRLKEGAPARTAIIEGAKGRFRPIMLTSVTTFLGFTPLILETAIQAQFLVPFAASSVTYERAGSASASSSRQ